MTHINASFGLQVCFFLLYIYTYPPHHSTTSRHLTPVLKAEKTQTTCINTSFGLQVCFFYIHNFINSPATSQSPPPPHAPTCPPHVSQSPPANSDHQPRHQSNRLPFLCLRYVFLPSLVSTEHTYEYL
jgi:hypothetical protein